MHEEDENLNENFVLNMPHSLLNSACNDTQLVDILVNIGKSHDLDGLF